MASVPRKGRKNQDPLGTSEQVIGQLDGRMPPQAIPFEEAVLGAILLEKDAYSRVSEMLSPHSFYSKAHELIYEAMTGLALEQKPIDMITVTEELRRRGTLSQVGGESYISGLTIKVFSTANLEYHADILARKALSRELISFSSEVLRSAYEDVEDVSEQMNRAEGKLFELAQNKGSKDFTPINQISKSIVTELQDAANATQDGITGLPSGFSGLDKITAGWQKSDLIIIAARPAMGKTAFVVSMAKNMVLSGIPVALFNLEMSDIQLGKRFLSNVCDIENDKLKTGRLSPKDWDRLIDGMGLLEKAPLYINDTPSLSVFELRTKARRLVREQGVKVIIIDYLQLMNASGMSFGNREQEVSTISRSLKMLAKELSIPIIALSQLNRSVENRTTGDANSKRPQLSDLRESGAIEQDADIVCFLHRPEYYKIYQDQDGRDLRGLAEFIIAKHRNGAIDDVRLTFNGAFTRFSDYDGGSSVTQGGHERIGSHTFGSGKAGGGGGLAPDSSAPF